MLSRSLVAISFAAAILWVTSSVPSAKVPNVVSPIATPAKACVSDRATSRQKVRQLIFAGFSGESPDSLRTLSKNGIGGFFLMGRVETAADLERAKLQLDAVNDGGKVSPVLPFISVDEEGGRVQRLAAVSREPSARLLGDSSDTAAGEAGSAIGAKLRKLGFNMNFAPDIDTDKRNVGVISDRSFSFNPKTVSSRAQAYAQGLLGNGITPVYKHFPGHGQANGDSHKLLPMTPPLAELEKHDLIPFRSAIANRASVVMMGHLSVPGLTAEQVPTTFTPAAYAYLRNMGFDGLIITDDLGMGALRAGGNIPERAVLAVDAGATMVLTATTIGVRQIADALEGRARTDRLFQSKVDAAYRRILRAKGSC
jgi:beta-N-acetylhexosaminidase